MKTKLILLNILLFFGITVIGQSYNRPPNIPTFDEKKWHFGFTLGPEYQNFKISNNGNNLFGLHNSTTPTAEGGGTVEGAYYYSDIPTTSVGLHVGIITSRRLGRYFNLRMIPSLSLGQRRIKSSLFIEETNGITTTVYPEEDNIISTTIKSTYLSAPFYIKYKAIRFENARPYVISGVNFKYDLSTDFEDPITLKKFDTYLEFGLGSDFYLQTFRFGIEVRFAIGLRNILETDRPDDDNLPYLSSSIDAIRAKTFTIAFNFE